MHELRPHTVRGRDLVVPHTHVQLRVDGAARGNPGPASAGVVIESPGGEVLRRAGRLLGRATNNEAEYLALLIGLDEARKLGATEIDVLTDSQLLAFQLDGRYRVKAANLIPLFQKAKRTLGEFARFSVTHVPRKENAEADRMANVALDAQADVDE